MKRKVDIVVISDVHLGTYGARAKELLNYLDSINPKTLILNGDIIDIWQFKKDFFPKEHSEVVYKLLNIASSGTPTYYLTGNHDDMLRRFSDLRVGNMYLLDKMLLTIKDKKAWIFHGDAFDASVNHARWIAKLGGKGYDLLLRFNRFINNILKVFGQQPMSFSKRIKDSVKSRVNQEDQFEQTLAELALDKGYDYVICGHIHKPVIKTIKTQRGEVHYMNSGDWIENLTALEYNEGEWSMFKYNEKDFDVIDTEVLLERELQTISFDRSVTMDLKTILNFKAILGKD